MVKFRVVRRPLPRAPPMRKRKRRSAAERAGDAGAADHAK
jgi:hypothetical protein